MVGQDRQNAETWLKVRFEKDQLPCTPTELHGEYITESIKNGNNLMTQVFLSYAQEDIETMYKVRRSLWLQGITVWTNTTDIQTGEGFREAIERGIEQADNLVYLLSPNSINSTYCQYEIDYAIALHKRIIPILVTSTPIEKQPLKLRDMQYIDLTDNEQEEDYLLDESQLLKILNTEEGYHQNHKILLTQAIKWERQHHNPSILLRGYNLQQAETWLKTAYQRITYQPTTLQIEFIEESLRQPPADSLDVFISYSRADADFARKLNDSLQIFGKLTWFDQESIATSSADFQQEIYRGIEVSDNFVFILSPDAINSAYCADEVEYAAKLNKRFVTILHRSIDTNKLHPDLARIQWLDFNRYDRDFGQNFNELIRALETDREHVRNHTKWSQRAIEWEQKERSSDLLLRGGEFAIAHNWLEESKEAQKKPIPTPLQEIFLKNSQAAIEAEIRKEKHQKTILRSLVTVMTGVSIMAICASIYAFIGQQKAARNEIQALAAVADADLVVNKEFDSLLIGLRAAQRIEKNPFLSAQQRQQLKNQITNTLQQTLYSVTEKNRFQHSGGVTTLAISPNGERIATADYDSVKIWTMTGQKIELKDKDFEIWNTRLFFSQDGKTLITIPSYENTLIKRWNAETGAFIGAFENGKKFKFASPLSVNKRYSTLTTFDGKFTQLWDETGQLITKIESKDEYGIHLNLSNDGQILISQETVDDSGKQQIKVRKRNGEEISQFDLKENFFIDEISSDAKVIFLSNGKTIESRNQQGELIHEIYKLDETKQQDFQISDLLISHDGTFLIINVAPKNTNSSDSTIEILSLTGEKISQEAINFTDEVFSSFSPDGKYFTSINTKNKSITLWNNSGEKLKILKGHTDWIYDVQFSPNSNYIASISLDGTLRLWSLTNQLVQSINSSNSAWSSNPLWHENRHFFMNWVKDGALQLHSMEIPAKSTTILADTTGNVSWDMTDDAQTIAIMNNQAYDRWSVEDASKYTVQVWHRDSNQLEDIIPKSQNKKGYVESHLSPDGKNLLMTTWQDQEKGFIELWNVEKKFLKTLLPTASTLHNEPVSWINNGENFVTIEQNKVKLWDKDGELVATLMDESDSLDQDSLRIDVIAHPKGDRLVTYLYKKGTYNNAVQLWDMQGKPIKTLIDQYKVVENDYNSWVDIQFDRNDFWILVSDYRKVQEGWNIKVQAWTKEGALLQWEENGERKSTLIDVKNIDEKTLPYLQTDHKNGGRVFTSETGKSIKIWNFQPDGLFLRTQELMINAPKILSFTSLSPDHQTLAIKSLGSGTISLWDLPTSELRGTLFFNSSAWNSDWSSDSQNFAVGSNDGTVQIWNRDLNGITELKNLGSAVKGLRFNTNDSVLTTTDEDQIVLYELEGLDSWDKVLQASCNWLTDYLKNDDLSANGNWADMKEEVKTLCDK